MLKLHPAVTKFKSEIKRVATLRGLAQIDFEEPYSLYKTGAKNSSPRGYPDEMLALRQGMFSVIGTVRDGETYVWIHGDSISEWFKTSPILSCRKEGSIYKIETENSYYELRPL